MKLISNEKDDFILIEVPGKILLCGGYSILYENGLGISLSINQVYQFKAYFNNKKHSIIVNQSLKDNDIIFDNKSIQIDNKFVKQFQNVITMFLNLSNKQYKGITYEIKIDNCFFQHEQKNFNNCYLKELKKSGLGSSSCFQVGLITCFYLLYFQNLDKKKIYILCLILNSLTQNKIGSGFDIFTAIYGCSLFQRIPSQKIKECIELLQNQNQKIFDNICFSHKQIHQNFYNYRYYLVDFIIGYDTVTSSKKFLQDKENENIFFVKEMNQIVNKLISIVEKQQFDELKLMCFQHRKLLQKFSIKKNIPIEPKEYSFFLDSILSISDDIIYGITPGAGGYDGLVLISKKPQDSIREIINKSILQIQTNYQNIKDVLQVMYQYTNTYEYKYNQDLEKLKNFKVQELSLYQLIYINGAERNYQI